MIDRNVQNAIDIITSELENSEEMIDALRGQLEEAEKEVDSLKQTLALERDDYEKQIKELEDALAEAHLTGVKDE